MVSPNQNCRSHLAQAVEYLIEVDEDLALADFGDVVQALGREVANPGFSIREAYQQCVDKAFHVGCNVCQQRDCGPCESNQTTIPDMQWIGRCSKEFDELVNYLRNALFLSLIMILADMSDEES
jgi:hypothetical protein